jgi:hypothetical protein
MSFTVTKFDDVEEFVVTLVEGWKRYRTPPIRRMMGYLKGPPNPFIGRSDLTLKNAFFEVYEPVSVGEEHPRRMTRAHVVVYT